MYSPCRICGCEWWRVYGGCAHIGGTGYTKEPRPGSSLPGELLAVAKVAAKLRAAETTYATAMERLDRQCQYALDHGFTQEQVDMFATDSYNPAAYEALDMFSKQAS